MVIVLVSLVLSFAFGQMPQESDRAVIWSIPWSYPAKYTHEMELVHEWKIDSIMDFEEGHLRDFNVESDSVYLLFNVEPWLYRASLDGKNPSLVLSDENVAKLRKGRIGRSFDINNGTINILDSNRRYIFRDGSYRYLSRRMLDSSELSLVDENSYAIVARKSSYESEIYVALRDLNDNNINSYYGSPYGDGLLSHSADSFSMLRSDGKSLYFAARSRAACMTWDIESGENQLIVVNDDTLAADWRIKEKNAERYVARKVDFTPVIEGFDILNGKPCFFIAGFHVNKMYAICPDDSGEIVTVYFALMPEKEPDEGNAHLGISPRFTTVNGETYMLMLHRAGPTQAMRVYRVPDVSN